MNRTCLKCAAHLESLWKFCPHCGAASASEAPKAAPLPQAHENAPAKSGFSGLLLGFLAAPVLIIYGTLICLMVGPWMVLGIPMIIAGICAPVVGPLIAISAVRGECPWCGVKISNLGPLDAFYCYACSKRIVTRKGELARAE